MNNIRTIFSAIPDTFITTDSFGYILDFNRKQPFDDMKKGRKLTRFLPDCFEGSEGEFHFQNRVYRRYTTKITNGNNDSGFTVQLTDITEITSLNEQLKKKSEELKKIESELSESNTMLMDFVSKVRELSDYSEQLRIAKIIHDDYGHALTELYTICQMCLTLKDTDPEKCKALLREGAEICRSAEVQKLGKEYDSLASMLHDFLKKSTFPVEVKINGEEPPFIRAKYECIEKMCKEAYHNTLSHSMADKFFIEADMDNEEVILTFSDNGNFRGQFEKGFGLSSMESYVRSSGGTVDFTAEEGKGFMIRAIWRDER